MRKEKSGRKLSEIPLALHTPPTLTRSKFFNEYLNNNLISLIYYKESL